MTTLFILASTASAATSLDVYVGYADSQRGNASNFPTPWDTPSNSQILFEGCRPASSCTFDSAAVRLVNNSTSSVTVNSVKVEYSSMCVYDIWPHTVSLAPGQQLILTQTKTTTSTTPGGCTSNVSSGAPGNGIPDGSDIGPNGKNYDHVCTLSGLIPQVDLTLNGSATPATFADSGQVLNTRGWDSAYCPSPGPGGAAKNESIPWTPIGSVPCLGTSLTLGPPSQSTVRGGVASVAAHLADSCGHPLQGAAVNFRVSGASAPAAGQTGSGTTDAQGGAGFTYADIASAVGTDKVQATIKNPSGTLASNSVGVSWVDAGGSAGTGSSSSPLSDITGFSLRPGSFRPAGSGPSAVAASQQRRFGGVASYQDSRTAITSFTVFRAVRGQKRGRSCVAIKKSRGHAHPCTRLVLMGFFTHNDAAGANRFRFTGRMRGHKLLPSNYVLQVVPHTSAGAGHMRTKSFRITKG
ncbi:MAG TPA: Ig-like domain-containing protein [Solirubrobacteraceae bacterium]|jgi:hypothetical protein|nr:Ig-like domain-containing protein [Solirubrobacteraceae bacterium]